MSELHIFLTKMKIQGVPIRHLMLKSKIYKMMLKLQYYTLLLNKYTEKEWGSKKITYELGKLKNDKKRQLKKNFPTEFLTLVDKWYLAY